MRKINRKLKNKYNRIVEFVAVHLPLSSIVVGVILSLVLMQPSIQRREILPHIITFASCNLALIGFVFSILLGLRGGEVHEKLSTTYPEQYKTIYRIVFKITLASMATILCSVGILSIPQWSGWIKWVVCIIGASIGTYMVLGTLLELNLLVELIIKDE